MGLLHDTPSAAERVSTDFDRRRLRLGFIRSYLHNLKTLRYAKTDKRDAAARMCAKSRLQRRGVGEIRCAVKECAVIYSTSVV